MSAFLWRRRLQPLRPHEQVGSFNQAFVKQYSLRQQPLLVRYRSSSRKRQQYQRFEQSRTSPLQSLLYQWISSPTFYYQVGGVASLAGWYYVTHIEEAPLTGRRRFMAGLPEFAVRYLEGTGQMVQDMYKDDIVTESDKRYLLAQRVLGKLIPQSGLPDKKWKLLVIDHPHEQNAMAFPGGEVVIFTGMMDFCETEDRLAAVMAHEVAHVVARHTVERISQKMYLMPVYAAAMLGVAAMSSGDAGLTITRMIFNSVLEYPANRQQEAEADFIGLMMMAQSCYRPEAAVSVWQRFQQLNLQQPPQFLSTHPSHKNREVQIQAWLPQAQDKYNMADCAYTGRLFNEFSLSSRGIGW